VTGLRNLGRDDEADRYDTMSANEYAEEKGFEIVGNPGRRTAMANGTITTKADLQDQIDAAIDTLDEAYAPESTREDLAEAIGSALDILRGEEDQDEDEGDEAGDAGDDDFQD
jgi:hypothetical protein